jgi:prepilin peptidase CpaA
MIYSVALFIFIAWAAVIAVCDCRSRRIPNSIVAAGMAAALMCALLQAGPFHVAAAQALLGAGVGLVALLPFFALGVMGAGDVKVFAVLGAWCGMGALPVLWLIATLLGGVHALGLLGLQSARRVAARKRLAAPGWQGEIQDNTQDNTLKTGSPYVACLSIAAYACLALHIHNNFAR